MKVVDVYSQYFCADCVCNGTQRNGALVRLKATSDNGFVSYEVGVTLYPRVDDNDWSVTFDACYLKEIYSAKGRRSKKRETEMMEDFRTHVDALVAEHKGVVLWDKPLTDPVYA